MSRPSKPPRSAAPLPPAPLLAHGPDAPAGHDAMGRPIVQPAARSARPVPGHEHIVVEPPVVVRAWLKAARPGATLVWARGDFRARAQETWPFTPSSGVLGWALSAGLVRLEVKRFEGVARGVRWCLAVRTEAPLLGFHRAQLAQGAE